MADEPKYPVKTVTKAIEIINYLAQDTGNRGIGVSELSRVLGMGKSTVHRLLDTLSFYGYVEQDGETNQYRLGWELYKIGQVVPQQNQLLNLNPGYILELSRKTRATVNLGILKRGEILIISKIEGAYDSTHISVRPGEYEAIHATGMGKVMISEMDEEEIRRLEELIPGTDQEDEPPQPQTPSLLYRLLHRPRREEPMPEDIAPQQLARTYGKGLKGLRLRSLAIFLLAAVAIFQLLVPALNFVWLPPLDNYQIQVWIACGLLGAGFLLSADVLFTGLARAFHGKVGMDTLCALSVIFTLADGLVLAMVQNREGQLPYTAAVLVGLFFLTHGTYHQKCGLRLACRTAAAAAEPYLLTLDEGKWNGRDTYCKWSGVPNGFGSQIQTDDGAQRIYRRYCPILLLACLLFSILSSVAANRPEYLLWCLSATFTSAAAFGSALVYGRPFHKVTRRLSQTGAALAGWPGLLQTRKGDRVLIYDGDLFPPGYVEFNGIKVFGDYSIERVLSYTATLIRDSGSGLTKLFHDLLRAQGGLFRQADHLCCYEGGGLSANIRGYQVLVGSASFMNLMEVPLPPGLNVKNAVFCAIDGDLAGIFALNYSLHDGVFPSLDALLREKVGPVLATRDFNIIPAMLHQRFKLASDKMDFPPVERRRELSDPEQPHNPILTAVLCREGLVPYADSVVGARRLRRATRFGAILTCVGSTVGVLLAYYLTAVAAFGSLSPLNLLIFLLTWLLPVWFLTSWVPRY